MVNLIHMEVAGATKEEAAKQVPFKVMGDATQSFRRWKMEQRQGVTKAAKKQFMADYLEKRSRNIPGVGFSITIIPSVLDKRNNPWKIVEEKKGGDRKYNKVFQFIDIDTGCIIAEYHGGTKADAKEYAKKIIDDGFKGRMKCIYTKQVTEGNPVAFTAEYKPSRGSRNGVWEFFGIEDDYS